MSLVNAWRERVDRILARDPEHLSSIGVRYGGERYLENVIKCHTTALQRVKQDDDWLLEWAAA